MSKRSHILGVSVAILVVLLAACAPQAAPAPAPAAPAPAPAAPVAPAKPSWEENWEKILEAARQEGRLVLYHTFGAQRRLTITNPFESKYGVRIESVSGATSDLYRKIFAEQKAGIYSGDVWVSGTATYVELKGALDTLDAALILPELTEPELIKKTWYFGEFPWSDKAHTALISLMDFQQPLSINTSLVKAGEIKAYRDLLDPKWKGKMSLFDPQLATMGRTWLAVVLELGDVDVNYIRQLITTQELFITRDQRLQVEWLAQGKHAIAIAPQGPTVTEFTQLGAPLDQFNPGTPFVSGSTSGISIMKKAPHPNAVKLFINWLLSQEGQTFHSRAVGAQSQRLDVPTSHLKPSKVMGPGLKLFRADTEEFAMKRVTVYGNLAKEILGR